MPSAAAHIAAAHIVKNKLHIDDDSFYVGAILPDILDMDKRVSHYKKQGSFYLVPRLEYYKDNHDLTNTENLGYYLHLYLDYYFLEDYLKNNVPNIDVFSNNIIYKDYDILSNKILSRFNVDKNSVISILEKVNEPNISEKKLSYNIKCLKMKNEGDLKILNENLFLDFIEKTSLMFIEDLEK